MAFSQATITHTFQNADGTPASGSIEFTLNKRMTNGTLTLVPSSLTANLNSTGMLSQLLTSTSDPLTVPNDAEWRVDIRILGAQAEQFFIDVPTGGGTIDLGALLPSGAGGG